MSTTDARVWPAPAKINLFLHIVGRRPDGYHRLQTVFRFLDFADDLRFAPRQDDALINTTALPGVAPADDLILRAATLLRQHTGKGRGVSIALDKRIPMGGGLGGGSSDAATTLLALNELWQCGLSRSELAALGLRLGADVPIFIHGRTAFAEGVGEVFTDVTPPPAWYLLVMPDAHLPTAEVFAAPDLRRDTPQIAPGDWRPGYGGNDMEPVACRLRPIVAETLRRLRALSPRAAMSGSGVCCFAEFDSEAAARQAAAALPTAWRSLVAQGLDRHPLA